MNWNPIHAASAIAAKFARTSIEFRKIPSRISGTAVRFSLHTNAARIAATAASESSVRAEPHPWLGASTSV